MPDTKIIMTIWVASKITLFLLSFLFSNNCHSQNIPQTATLRAIHSGDSGFRFIHKQTKRLVSDMLFAEVEVCENGYIKAFAKDKWWFITTDGSLIDIGMFDEVRNFSKKLAAVRKNKLWGFINEKGAIAVPLTYQIVFDFSSNQTMVCKAGNWQLINQSGITIKEIQIDSLYGINNNLLEVVSKGKYLLMNTNGKVLEGPKQFYIQKKISKENKAQRTTQCPLNLDFENGNFLNWSCSTGSTGSSGGVNFIALSPSGPVGGRHTIITVATPSALDPYGLFPINPPNGTSHAIKLGNNGVNAQAEGVRYAITVPYGGTDFSVVYYYAVVFQDPNHASFQQPRFTAKVFDPVTNTYLDCASIEYVSTSGLPGFQVSPVNSGVRFKPWSAVTLNLSRYQGQTIYLEFASADCTLGGHFGYAYVDVECGIPVTPEYFCTDPTKVSLKGPNGFQQYKWWNNDFNALLGTGQSVTISPAPPNNTQLWLEVIPFNGFGCRDTIKVLITKPAPLANAGADKQFCKGEYTILGAPALPGYTYSWSPGAYLSNPTSANPVCNAPANMSYELTVVNANNCEAKDTVNVQVGPKPIAGFTISPAVQCLKDNNFTFSNTSVLNGALTAYKWNFGDGTTATIANPSHTYTVPGTYVVQLITENEFNCSDTITKTITVFPSPVAGFTTNTTAQCYGNNTFPFSNTSSISSGSLSYLWTFGDGISTTIENPVHSYQTPGNYTVKLVVMSENGCKDSVTRPIRVNPDPSSGFSINTPAQCFNGNLFTFSNTSSISSGNMQFIWTFGDGISSSITNPTHSYASAGNYIVKLLLVSDSHCKDSISFPVKVNPSPIANYSINTNPQCFSNNVFVFTNLSTIAGDTQTFSWNLGDGTNTNQSGVTHSYTSAGVFPVKLLSTSSNGCKDSTVRTIIVNANPQITVSTNKPPFICNGDSVHFNAIAAPGSGSIVSYQWYKDGLLMSGAVTNTLTVTQSGGYQVKVFNSNGCSTLSAVTGVVVYPLPTGTVSSLTGNQICQGSTILLTATGGSIYEWYRNGTVISGVSGSSYNAALPGTYSVILISDKGCRSPGADSIILGLLLPPKVEFSYKDYCVNKPVFFSNLSDTSATGPVDMIWRFSDGDSSAARNPSHIFTTAGTYNVKLIITPRICPKLRREIQKVIYIENPPLGIRYKTRYAVRNELLQLAARIFVTANSYNWQPSVGLSNPTISTPVFKHSSSVDYSITVKLKSGCQVVDTQAVWVYPACSLFVPNSFTPNNDGLNDIYKPIPVGIKQLFYFRIVNRFGQQVYETSELDKGWDGIFNGQLQPVGNYVWYLRAVCENGTVINDKGNCVLIR